MISYQLSIITMILSCDNSDIFPLVLITNFKTTNDPDLNSETASFEIDSSFLIKIPS